MELELERTLGMTRQQYSFGRLFFLQGLQGFYKIIKRGKIKKVKEARDTGTEIFH
jgi:hypothetical protein